MNYDVVRGAVVDLWSKACSIRVHCALIAWHDVLGLTSVRSIYADEYWEVKSWLDERVLEYGDREYYAWMDGEMVSCGRCRETKCGGELNA